MRFVPLFVMVGLGGGCQAGMLTDDTSVPDGAAESRPIDAGPNAAPIDAAPPPTSLDVAIVGDTRPPNEDDTSGYPTSIITKIWQDVAAAAPAFAVTTGDYMFASTSGTQQGAQLDKYLTARSAFTGTVYAAMGNHECTGATNSNCGAGATDGVTKNYNAFMTRMLQPLGYTTPYYVFHSDAPDGSWTAKFVVVACNAWNTAQSDWLKSALAENTTYTFVIRHEGTTATTAPCVTPSGTIINSHPLTLLIVGHTHTYAHYASDREVIVGNGGAPLTSGTNYGYALATRRASDGAIELTAYDYQTGAQLDHFAVHADGTAAP